MSTLDRFLDTVKLWLASATDAEVLRLLALVTAEAERRGLEPKAPQAERET